jgi:ABC-type transport system involved in cytochrome bd biosynthesis fused ATPase/permease subunit
MVLMAALLLVAIVLALRPRAAHAGEAADDFDRSALRSLRAEVEALRAGLRDWATARAATERAAAEAARDEMAAANVRFELAHARAGAVRAGPSPRPVQETNR